MAGPAAAARPARTANEPGARRQPRRSTRSRSLENGVGALFALGVAILLYSRFSADNLLSHDEAIYAYAGQQFAHGVPFYSAIFEQKTPLAAILAGIGAVAARVLGANDLHAIRIVFFVFSCLTVVGIYLLATQLWKSRLTGVLTAAVFACFKGFAVDALGGPDAKTPGICFAVFSMVLLSQRRWFWGAFVGSLAFLVWQPLGVYVALAVLLAATAPGRPRPWNAVGRAVAGAAIPIASIVIYLWLAGALGRFVDAAVLFPLTGLQRKHETLAARFSLIGRTVAHSYGTRGVVLIFGGLILLSVFVAARAWRLRRLASFLGDPYCGLVFLSFVPLAVFSLIDFQGYPDVFPVLPYAAIGWAGAWAATARRVSGERARLGATALAVCAVAALVGLSWHSFANAPQRDPALRAQWAKGAAVNELLHRDETLYVFQDPRPLVLTRRRNPSRFIYVASGVDKWIVQHTRGGFAGWKAQVAASHPVIVIMGRHWRGPWAKAMKRWLHEAYVPSYLQDWRLFVTPVIRKRALARGIILRNVRAPPPVSG